MVGDASIHNIMGGMESTAGVRLHNHRRKLKQRFDIIKKLGQGTYGKVQLGINKETGQEVAIKTIKKAKIETEADLVRIRREIQIMSSVQHPNIIHIYEVFENREKMVLVMEYAAGGELYDYLSERKVLAQEEARRIFRQIATAVYYCHKHKICHRDLKLENILLDEHGSAKIADFGLSNVFDEQRLLNTFCGSPLYASPEIVKGTPYHGPEVDCWSLGVLLYTLVYGAMPFDGSNFKRLVKQISQGDYFEPKKPSPASPLIRDMLTVAPARRADIEKICSHWWVNEDYTESCLDIAEELANQTPVRLDLLLSLAPPAPGVGSDKLLVTKDQGGGDGAVGSSLIPPRCHSVGSLMELDHPSAERRLKEFGKDKQRENNSMDTPKRKLEEGVSTEEANQCGAKRKERSRRRERDRSTDRRHHRSNSRNKHSGERNKSGLEMKDEILKVDQGDELMDVDVDNPAISLQEVESSLRESEETIVGSMKAAASSIDTIGGSTSAMIETAGVENGDASPKTPEGNNGKNTAREKTTRKSVKKKSKVPTEGGIATEIADSKTQEKNGIEELKKEVPLIQSVTSDNVQPGESVNEVKVKVKRKKQIPGEIKTDDNVGSVTDGNFVPGITQKDVEINGNSCRYSSPDSKVLKDSREIVSEGNNDTDVSGGISGAKTDVLDIQERSASKPIEVPKKTGVKTRKSKGELCVGKQGSSSEKSSGTNTPEDTASPPSRLTERRRSKIFETAEKFNNLLSGSNEPKSPTIEKPKKVFIPGVKVSDAKRAFERKSSLPEAILPTYVKNSLSKKLSETNTEIAPRVTPQDSGNDVSVIQKSEKKTAECNEKKSSSSAVKDQHDIPESSKPPPSNIDKNIEIDKNMNSRSENIEIKHEDEKELQLVPALQVTDKAAQQEEARIKKLKDAAEVISNAIAEESRKENLNDSNRKVGSAKPPVPVSENKVRARGVGIGSPTASKSPPLSPLDPAGSKKMVRVQVAPNNARLANIQVTSPETTKFSFSETDVNKQRTEKSGTENINSDILKQVPDVLETDEAKAEQAVAKCSKEEDSLGKKKSAKVEITLKSATLPRRKTSKAEIQLGSPSVPPVEYKTEVEHMIGSSSPNQLPTQRSEVAFPIAAVTPKPSAFRSLSLEPEGTPSCKNKPRERIIPIQLENANDEVPPVSSPPPARPPVPPLQQQRSLSQSQRSSSLSRQSTQESDTEGPEPIQKSPREFIIPIAMEGGGYVTPRAGSLEPSASDESTTRPKQRSTNRFGRPRRMSSLLSDASEDEGFNSPFATLQRHSSLGRDDDDDKPFHMHRLRSSRPTRRPLEHNDSLSSAEEEDDDDDGFEILTAESLFSTLLSRVRSLTQRLNVEDGSRPGFPSSRLMNQLTNIGHTSPSTFWNNVYGHQPEPLSRRLSESSQFSRSFSRDSDLGSTPWRRSVSRDVSDCDSVYSETSSTAGTLPRGSTRQEHGVCDDAASEISSSGSSYPYHYTPSLARRISHHYKHHSANEDLGGQTHNSNHAVFSPDERPLRKDSLSSIGNSLAFLQSQENAHYLPNSSRRLARTFSMRSATEERSRSGPKRREYLPPSQRSISLFESGDNRKTDESSVHGSSLSDAEDFRRQEYLPPTRRSLRLLDNDNRSLLTYRGSSASDSGDYYYRKPWEVSHVLPPLPHNVPQFSRRKDASVPRSYARQRSAELTDGLYGSQKSSSNRRLHSKIVEVAGEDVHDRPKHSSSLPSMAGNKSSHYKLKDGTVVPVIHKDESVLDTKNENQAELQLKNVENKTAMSLAEDGNTRNIHSEKSALGFEADSYNNNALAHDSPNAGTDKSPAKEQDMLKTYNKISAVNWDHLENSVKRNRSQIPSLLRFRSSSVCGESEKEKAKVAVMEQESTAKCPRSSRLTPDKSILSKFFKQSSEERGKNDSSTEVNGESKEGDKDLKKKTRRISRFLRPDFFDTPREESSYVKEKEAQKAAEAEMKKAKRIARRAALMEKKGKEIQKGVMGEAHTQNPDCESASVGDTEKGDKKTTEDIKTEATEVEVQQSNSNLASDSSGIMKSRNSTRSLCLNDSILEKQASGSNKNRFLHSLEKKLEKIRSSGDDIHAVTPSGKSRVEKAIRSLREHSTSSRGSDLMTTESTLLKRAVSVDDVCAKSQASLSKGCNASSSKLGSKVSSVLGLFRKMEDSPQEPQKTVQNSSRPSMLLSRLRRTQSVYAGCQSDSLLLTRCPESTDLNTLKLVGSFNEKASSSNASEGNSVVNNASISVETPSENLVVHDTNQIQSKSEGEEHIPENTIDNSGPLQDSLQQTQVTTVCQNKSANFTNPIPPAIPPQDDKIVEKAQSTGKTVKEFPSQKDSMFEKSTTTSETQLKPMNNKTSVKKNNSKKSMQNTSVGKSLKNGSTLEERKPGKQGTNKEDPSVVKSESKCVSETGVKDLTKKNPEIPETSVCGKIISQDTKDMCKTEDKVPVPKTSLAEKCKDCIKTGSGVVSSEINVVTDDTTETTVVRMQTENCSGVPELSSEIKPAIQKDEAVKLADKASVVLASEQQTSGTVQENDVKLTSNISAPSCDCDLISVADSPTFGSNSEALNDSKFAVKSLDCCHQDDSSSIISPADELESLDSWSICSDFEAHDLPTSPLPFPVSDNDGVESVEDRIRRKSFYSRFNDIKKKSHRKVSPSYVRSPNYPTPSSQHCMMHESQLLDSSQNVENHLTHHSRNSPVLSKSSSEDNTNRISDNESSKLQNGYIGNTHLEDTKKYTEELSVSTENNIDQPDDLHYGMEQPHRKSGVLSSNSRESFHPHISIAGMRKGSTGQLLRPADFTHDVLRRSSVKKSRLPTASWDKCAASPASTRQTNPSSRIVRTGLCLDSTPAEGESTLFDGKYNRFNTESSPPL